MHRLQILYLRKKGKKGINYCEKSALCLVYVNRKVIDEMLLSTLCILGAAQQMGD